MSWHSFIHVNNMVENFDQNIEQFEFICMHGQYYTYRLRSTLLKSVETTERLVAVLSIVFFIIAT